jgi:uncharacterized coiled-coil protein SlyX
MPPLDTTLDDQSQDQRYAMDNKLYVVFFVKPVHQGGESELQGRPIYKDVPYIRIHVPGDKTTVIEEPVNEEHKMRFASRWEKFEKGLSQAPDGTPVEEWPQVTRSQAAEFKALNIFTVEQLANLSDALIGKFMGGGAMRLKAQAFLAAAKDTAEAQRLATENAELNGRLAKQDEDIRRLSAQVEALMTKAAAPSSAEAEAQRERPSAVTRGR